MMMFMVGQSEFLKKYLSICSKAIRNSWLFDNGSDLVTLSQHKQGYRCDSRERERSSSFGNRHQPEKPKQEFVKSLGKKIFIDQYGSDFPL
jgi:hypothetical protein